MVQEQVCTVTDEHVEGPYYRPGAPNTNDLYPADSKGPVLWFRGAICDENCRLLSGALIEVWHADDLGRYDNDNPSLPPDPTYYRCRAQFRSDSIGEFVLKTVLPSNYKVPDGEGWTRVKHIHFKVFLDGYRRLTTEIALLPDDYTQSDPLFNPNLATKIEQTHSDVGGKIEYAARFEIVLQRVAMAGYAASARMFRKMQKNATR